MGKHYWIIATALFLSSLLSPTPVVAQAPYFLENYLGWGAVAQCGYNSPEFLYGSGAFEVDTWTKPVRMDTDNRSGGCTQQFGFYDPSGRLLGLRLKVDFQGPSGQCGRTGTHVIVPTGSLYPDPPYSIDTDDKTGYCTQTFSIEGRSDVALDVSFEDEAYNGQCGNAGTYPVVLGRSATFYINTDSRPGGCRQKFRLRLNTDADGDGVGDQVDSCPYVYGTNPNGCGICGNGLCESGESSSCPGDCPSCSVTASCANAGGGSVSCNGSPGTCFTVDDCYASCDGLQYYCPSPPGICPF